MIDHHSACCGVDAAAEVLDRVFRIPVEKAIDPLDPKGYMRIVGRLTDSLHSATRDTEAQVIRAALDTLDVDWGNLTAAARERVMDAVRVSISDTAQAVAPRIAQSFEIVGPSVYDNTRTSAIRKFGFDIGTSLTQRDERAVEFITRSNANFITNEYGQRGERLSARARSIVADGLDAGLGRDEISAELHAHFATSVMRGADYWQVVAAQFVNSARTYSQLSAYQDAGVETYIFDAVLDEVTTEQCRFYHGQRFSVGESVKLMDQLAALTDPNDVKNANPWVRSGRDGDGNGVLYFNRGGERTVIANVVTPGVGNRDAIGTYSNAMSSQALQKSGVPIPPLHGRCRSTINPDV